MTFNAFTRPRAPVFDTPFERAKQKQSDGGKKGGAIRHRQDNGNIYTTTMIKPQEKRK